MASVLIIYVSVKPRYSPDLISSIVLTPFFCKHVRFLTPLSLFLFCLLSILFSSYFHHKCIWSNYLTLISGRCVQSFKFFVCFCKLNWNWNYYYSTKSPHISKENQDTFFTSQTLQRKMKFSKSFSKKECYTLWDQA